MIPRPASTRLVDGSFTLDARTGLFGPPETAAVASWLRATVGAATGLPLAEGPGLSSTEGPGLPSTEGPGLPLAERPGIRLSIAPELPAEGYRLRVRPDGITIAGGEAAGVFYGAQTLRQLLPPAAFRRAPVHSGPWQVPAVDITDEPRFGWRGVLIDVVRHFVPVHDLLRYVDLLAMHKLNVLHLHLTDDQGWRVQIRRYPRLTSVGSWRRESMIGDRTHERFDGRPHGGFYTQDDIREIVSYAAARHITVVPEIDIPGHTQAAIAAYPELGNGVPVEVWTRWGISPHVLNVADATIGFFRDVLDEILDLFPSRYIGVGGDECGKAEWVASSSAQQRITALGLGDERGLQSWFVRQFDTYLTERGRRLYGWDEISEGGLAPGATVASWRGTAGAVAAARAGHDVVLCPDTSTYLDYRQSEHPDEPIPVGTLLTVKDVYGFDPLPPGLPDDAVRHVLGAQCNVWTEHIDSARAMDYMVFPRLCAFAETVWGSPDRDLADFKRRLATHLERLDAAGVEYRPLGGPHPWQTRPDACGRPRETADHPTD